MASGKERTALSRQRAKEIALIKEGGDVNVWKEQMENMKFVKSLMDHEGNLIAAVKSTFPLVKGVEQRYAKGQEMLMRTKHRMASAIKAMGLDPTYIIASVADLAENAERDADRLKGYEMLAKMTKMYSDGGKTEITNNLNITEDAAVRILERRRKHDIGNGGTFLGVGAGSDSDDNDGEEIAD